MLWYKAWLETRWRFLIGLVLLIFSAFGTVLAYPRVVELLSSMPAVQVGGTIGEQIREGLALARDYRGYIWAQFFRQNLIQTWTLFAVLLGSGSAIAQMSGGGTLFTLSLPASRADLVRVRVATGFAELAALALLPSLAVPMLSLAVGEHYGVAAALVHAACLFAAGTAFFSLAFLLSTLFSDLWRPLLLACGIAFCWSIVGQLVPAVGRYSIFRVMSAESYFRGAGVPWVGLAASVAVSIAMLVMATKNIERQDF